MRKSKLRIGEILMREGTLTQAQLDEALRSQKTSGRTLGDIIVDKGFTSEKDLANALAKQLDIPFASLNDGSLKPSGKEMAELVPESFARSQIVLPLSKHLKSLTVAFANPLDLLVIDNLKKITGCEINPIIATKKDLREAVDKFYGHVDLLKEAVDSSYSIEEEGAAEAFDETTAETLEDLISRAEEAPVVKLVDLMLIQAVREKASDIHIEPFKDRINVRIRVDGILHPIAPPSQHLLPALISRIKILSNMDIAERRLPQDGGFVVKIEDRPVDIRASLVPTIFGEKAVLRILDKGAVSHDLDKLGFSKKDLEVFKRSITRPYGLVFITGPTGSGKTTTLYSALSHVKSSTKNIMTVEDPVEYQLTGINQVQVKPKIGLTFAASLRSFLRQDPDIIMVGEVRDIETAGICVRAALTGHLVFSTLHTNDAPAAITRLIDIGIERFLVASSVVLIMAQRLIRKLCPKCKEPADMPDELIKQYDLPKKKVFKAKGCEYCRNTGYSGRIAITEVLAVDEDIREMIVKGASLPSIREAAKKSGMTTLVESGIEKVLAGVTSVDEIASVTFV
ncbi:MAG: ATPase, T2SS/T4P/T4SS family [Candidatus Omnitrophota bacterium]